MVVAFTLKIPINCFLILNCIVFFRHKLSSKANKALLTLFSPASSPSDESINSLATMFKFIICVAVRHQQTQIWLVLD